MLLPTACTDNDDNPAVIVDPATSEDDYTIEVETGLTLPENEFLTKVPAATDFDPDVISALESIDKVTDVKPFTMKYIYNPDTKQFDSKTAYFFNYKQLIDHNNPSKGWFKQQCVLSVAGKDRPTVLVPEGYALGSGQSLKNRLDLIKEPLLVSLLDANCLRVEHRYFGWSLPEGYTNKWNYLSAKQNSDDLHAIVTAFRQCGIVGQGKWLSTGVSKPGMTTAFYASEYPDDMDAYVPFCAPFMLSLSETSSYDYILTANALGDHVEKVKAAFRAYCGNRTLQQETVKLVRENDAEYRDYDDETARINLLWLLFDNYWAKMSYVPYRLWDAMVPKEGDSAEKFLTFIMTDRSTRYEGETDIEYQRRQNDASGLESSVASYLYRTRAMRRAATEGSVRLNPYVAHTCVELGAVINTIGWVDDLLTETEKTELTATIDPAEYGFNYDNGAYMRKVFDNISQSSSNIMFVYGKQDPWTGNRIPDNKLGKNCQILYIAYGTHNDAIDTWSDAERTQLFQWLKSLGFDL